MIKLGMVLAGVFWWWVAFAQIGLPAGVAQQGPYGASSSFTGVVDVEGASVVHFWGLVAPGSAHTGVAAVDLSNNTTTCVGVLTLANGQLDVASGLYCNGGTQTVTAWCSTNCVAGGSARITQLYDAIGSAPATAAYATAPGFVLSGVAAKPTMQCLLANSSTMSATITSINAPWSAGVTYERYDNYTGVFDYLANNGSSFVFGTYGAANEAQGQIFGGISVVATGGGGAGGSAVPTDGTSVTDFTHMHAALFTVPATTGVGSLYIDGGAPATNSAGVNITSTTITFCGYSGNFSDGYMTRAWLDNTMVGTATAENVTNKATVPLP